MVLFPPSSPENEWDSDDAEDGIADQDPLDLNWLNILDFHIAVCSLPGNRYAGARRSMVADLETLKKAEIEHVVVLCTEDEMKRCKVGGILDRYCEKGLVPHHLPLDSEHPLSLASCLRIVKQLHLLLMAGHTTLVHCTDGLGRSCLILALFAMYLDESLDANTAIDMMREARGHAAIQTIKQYNFIMEYRRNFSEYRRASLCF